MPKLVLTIGQPCKYIQLLNLFPNKIDAIMDSFLKLNKVQATVVENIYRALGERQSKYHDSLLNKFLVNKPDHIDCWHWACVDKSSAGTLWPIFKQTASTLDFYYWAKEVGYNQDICFEYFLGKLPKSTVDSLVILDEYKERINQLKVMHGL